MLLYMKLAKISALAKQPQKQKAQVKQSCDKDCKYWHLSF